MTRQAVQPLIFTDLDGTLLDHHSYSPAPADNYVRSLADMGIPVIAMTSKTRAETSRLMQSIAGAAMFSTENGAMVHAPQDFLPESEAHPDGLALDIGFAEIQTALDGLPERLREKLIGFTDMSAAQVADETGLSLSDAQDAKARQATEPFLWSGDDAGMTELEHRIHGCGLQIQRGGRFFHLTGKSDKAAAMHWFVDRFRKQMPNRQLVSIALGDGPNDLAMIEGADHGIIIPNPDGSGLRSEKPSVISATRPGPQGWIDAVQQILAGLDAM